MQKGSCQSSIHISVYTDISSTIRSTRSHGRTLYTATWTCCRVFFCSGPLSKLKLLGSLSKWVIETHPNEEYVASKIQRGKVAICLFLGWKRGQMQQLILPLRKGISPYPLPLTLRNFIAIEDPWISVGFISHPLSHKCLTNKSKVIPTSCSLDPISVLVVD